MTEPLPEDSPWWAAHLPAEYIDNVTGKRFRVTGVTVEEVPEEPPEPPPTP
jgi:hypothetical protein